MFLGVDYLFWQRVYLKYIQAIPLGHEFNTAVCIEEILSTVVRGDRPVAQNQNSSKAAKLWNHTKDHQVAI